MTADYTYGTYAVYDPTTNTEVDNGTGGKFVLVVDGAAQPIYDLLGNPITEITSNALGQSSQFRANVPNGLIQFGTTAVTVFANEVGAMAVAAFNAISGLSSGLTSAQVQGIVGGMFRPGTGIDVAYDPVAGTITPNATTASGAVLVGKEFKHILVEENSDGSYPARPTGMVSFERVKWVGRNSPKDLGIGVAGDLWGRLPS